MRKMIVRLFIIAFLLHSVVSAQRPPIMGWSSWNHFRVRINEQMIREQADALLSSGMYAAGYRFINIDDGFFGGRDSAGRLLTDLNKFPSGMGALASYIHSKHLSAGIYTDAGRNTCGSIYDKDSNGVGAGIYGHMEGDVDLFLRQWKFDFLKVDWCGGEKMKLDEQTEYLKLLRYTRGIRNDLVFNICRWKFPGEWAIREADSWRISGDIRPEFSSILKIIDLNADLYKYASPGHYNDMDMLQVGRGMTYEEDKTHFSMWCIMNSPLLAGNDLRNMSAETISILCNHELIAINQDISYVQARRLRREGEVEIWEKLLGDGSQKVLAILNRSSSDINYQLTPEKAGTGKRSRLRDLWQHKDLGKMVGSRSFTIPAHGILVLKISR